MTEVLPERHSISAMQKFEECPKAYRFRYIDKPDEQEPDAEHLGIGRAIHAGFEWAYREALDTEYVGPLSAVADVGIAKLREAWDEEDLSTNEIGLDAAIEATRRTLAGRSVDYRNILGIEYEFDLTTPSGVRFIGYADLVERVDETSLEILDWKSSLKPKEPDAVLTSFQLNCYGWAAKQAWPWAENIWVGENYPMCDDAVRVRLEPSHMRFALVRLQADVEALEVEEEWPTVTGHHCRWCNYRELCPALAGLPSDQLQF